MRAMRITATNTADDRIGSCVTSIAGPNMRNCTKDEGRSFEAGSHVLASNRCKLLSSRAMVVSVAVNVGKTSRRVSLREASASEPPDEPGRLGPPGGMKQGYAGAPPGEEVLTACD